MIERPEPLESMDALSENVERAFGKLIEACDHLCRIGLRYKTPYDEQTLHPATGRVRDLISEAHSFVVQRDRLRQQSDVRRALRDSLTLLRSGYDGRTMREIERDMVIPMYLTVGAKETAKRLGMSVRAVHYKIREYRDNGEFAE